MEGVMPKDVIARTFQTGAMQGLLSGTGGSPLGQANEARQYGLTELDLMNQGANLLGNASQRWQQMANFGASTLMPIQSMLITPEQQAQQTESNRLIQRQIQQERYNVAAAPNPIAKGLSDIVMYLTGQYLGSLGGGKMGGGGAGGLPQAGNAAATSAEGSSDWMTNLLQGTGNPASAAGGVGGFDSSTIASLLAGGAGGVGAMGGLSGASISPLLSDFQFSNPAATPATAQADRFSPIAGDLTGAFNPYSNPYGI